MRRQTLVALLGIALLAGATAAWAQLLPRLELSPYMGPYGGETIEVPPGDIEILYFHITEPGLWHVQNWSFHPWVVSGTGGTAWLTDLIVQPTTEYQGSVWYPFGVIRVDGVPSTTIGIQIDLLIHGLGLPPSGLEMWSNAIYKHITPEPSSILALGMGALGMGGLILRRRRS